MKMQKLTAGIILVATASGLSAPYASAMRVSEAIWGDGELYGTVATPTSFSNPPLHSTDMIYNFSMSGLNGQRSVAESVPGDPDHNGGRWNVQMVVFTAEGLLVYDTDGDNVIDGEITSAEELLYGESMGYVRIMPANFYFECPLLPERGRS